MNTTTHKSKRLTYDLRDNILNAFRDKALKEERENLKTKVNKLAIGLYTDNFSKIKQDLMTSLPTGFLPKTNSFTVCFGQAVDGGVYRAVLDNEVLIPYSVHKNDRTPIKIYEPKSKFYKEWEYIITEEKRLRKKHSDIYSAINSIIHSVNTTKQLIAVWPESKEVVLSICDVDYSPSATSVPAIRIQEVNKLLGL